MLCVALPQVIAESGSPIGGESRPYYDFLETCLRHKAEMVIFEAARAICEMRDVSSRSGFPALQGRRLLGNCSPMRDALICECGHRAPPAVSKRAS